MALTPPYLRTARKTDKCNGLFTLVRVLGWLRKSHLPGLADK
jgi:hypothetical protein